MFNYKYDPETNGIVLLTSEPSKSPEARPVWYQELDILGFDKVWQYEKSDVPLLWAERQFYWYRGKRVAKTIGGSFFQQPKIALLKDQSGYTILPEGSVLKPVNVKKMLQKNTQALNTLEQKTIKRTQELFTPLKDNVCSHIAFSGGKDSMALLEIVRRSISTDDVYVIFGDTSMEMTPTYAMVNAVEAWCKEHNLEFFTAKSHLTPEQS